MLHTTYYAAVMFFSIAGPAFLLHLQPLLLLPLHHYAATLRVRVFGVQKSPYFNPLQGPQPCLPAWPVYFYIFVFFPLEGKKICCVIAWVGRERERCVCFQWLFTTILIQTRLINQFTTFFFFIQCTHAIVKIC
jgi:hypothetical protein